MNKNTVDFIIIMLSTLHPPPANLAEHPILQWRSMLSVCNSPFFLPLLYQFTGVGDQRRFHNRLQRTRSPKGDSCLYGLA